jgi:PAS domain S-box-containing protein
MRSSLDAGPAPGRRTFRSPSSIATAVTRVSLALAACWLATYLLGGAGIVAPHWFYIPIILAAVALGPVGTVVTAVVAGLLAGPLMPADVANGVRQSATDWGSRLTFFVVIGWTMWVVVNRRQVAETRLRAAHHRYQTLVEQLPVVVYMNALDEASTALYVSPYYEEMFGFSPEERLADPELWHKRLHPDDRDRVVHEAERATGAGDPLRIEYRMIAKDGRTVWVREQGALVGDDDGRAMYWQGVLVDVTDRKAAEEKVRRSEERYRQLFERHPQPMWVYATDTMRFLAVNDAAIELYGYLREEFLSMTIDDIRSPGDVRAPGRDRSATSGTVPGDVGRSRHRRKDGSVFPVDIVSYAMQLGGRDARLVVATDVTELAQAEERRARAEEDLSQSYGLLRRAHDERRRLMGRLVRAEEAERRRIALDLHDDVIQELTAAGLRLAAARRRDGEDLDSTLSSVEGLMSRTIARLRRLVIELRPEALDRPGGIQTTLRARLRELADDGVRVSFDDRVAPDVERRLSVDARTLCYRIANEALANVRKHSRARRVDVAIDSRDNGIAARIADDGIGFVFDEATAAADGHVGLASMRERAELVGGWLRVTSEPEHGTTVEFWIPASTAAEREQRPRDGSDGGKNDDLLNR